LGKSSATRISTNPQHCIYEKGADVRNLGFCTKFELSPTFATPKTSSSILSIEQQKNALPIMVGRFLA
jgi:hypothetical protein